MRWVSENDRDEEFYTQDEPSWFNFGTRSNEISRRQYELCGHAGGCISETSQSKRRKAMTWTHHCREPTQGCYPIPSKDVIRLIDDL